MRSPWFLLFGLLVSCAGTTEDEGGIDLSGREFMSESLEGRTLVTGTEIRVLFRESNLSAHAGCNTMSGNYRFDGSVLVVSEMGSTEIGCDPPLSEQDEWLAGFLQARPAAELAEPRLTLASATETLTLIDREVGSPDRELVGTHWVGNGIGDGTSVSIGPGSDLLTVMFGSDGRVAAFSGCQHGSGDFFASKGVMEITDFTFDGVPCSNPTLDDSSDFFVATFGNGSAAFAIEERQLMISRGLTTFYFLAAD